MKSQNNQLKSADIGHGFCVLTKTEHVGHVSHSIFVPEFEFDHNNLKFLKTQSFQNLVESTSTVFLKTENSVFFKNFKILWSNSNSGNKIEWETCPTCLVLVKTQNSWQMSADFS